MQSSCSKFQRKSFANVSFFNKTFTTKPGWNEQNANEIFNSVLKLLQQAFAFCKEANIACVSFSAAMHSLLAVDKNGKPLMNMLPGQICAALNMHTS